MVGERGLEKERERGGKKKAPCHLKFH